ncbi:MAG: aminotransferase class V-fold PLP-dependent enzyme, partial [Candidatus Aminicenantes bacterium]|nr:aminotransferase class V-fold PLP-dependent enzyme [Candidatus Aminicenantes bacterium]
MLNRRAFLRLCGALGTAAYAAKASGLEGIEAASQSVADRMPGEVAKDEFYWREIQLAFKLDRTLINLNNGFTCPCPRVVLESVWRYMEMIN